MIIFFLILTTLIDQLCDKSIYRPYLRLMTGFMLISLMMQPISYYLSNEDIVTQAISTAVKGENNPAFLDGAKEEHFSRLCKTLEGVIKFLLKGFLSVLLGVQLIQSMILPAVDSMKNTVLQKGMSAIPGIGSGLNSAMTMVIGSAVVIKNSIGAVGILVLIVIIVPPVIEITAVVLTYLLAGIMIQPISDKRITGAMDAVIQSGKLMLSMIFTMALLFILSVALIAFSTNVNYYAG